MRWREMEMEMEMERFIKIICDTKEGLTQGKSQCVNTFWGIPFTYGNS
jgi:hypothetical protein